MYGIGAVYWLIGCISKAYRWTNEAAIRLEDVGEAARGPPNSEYVFNAYLFDKPQ